MARKSNNMARLESALVAANEKFRANNCWYEIYILGGCIQVEITWGDWKHDHGYVDYIMRSLGLSKLDERITEEDQSDTYSSIHIYR